MTRKLATKKTASRNLRRPKTASLDLEAWFSHQGIQPVEDVNKLLGQLSEAWPEGEDVDQFLDDVYRSCRGRPYRRKR